MTEYVARLGTPDGSVVEQRHRAVSGESLRRELENKGFKVFRVEPRRGALRIPFLHRREKLNSLEFLTFNQQLATLLKAGIPILQSLELLQRAQSGAVLRDVLAHVLEEIRGGASLSDAFAAQGGLFPPLYCATVFAGERAGELVSVLTRYIHHQQLLEAVRRRVVSALTYPLVLICLSSGLIVLLMTYVIPRFATFYLGFGADLPLPTKIVVGTAQFLHENLPWEIGGLLVAIFLLRRWAHTDAGGVAIDHAKLRIPFIGQVIHLFGLSQFVRSLGTLVAGGTPLVNSLEIASGVVTNRAMGAPLSHVAPRVREGQPLWSSLEATKLFPELSLAMVQVGEATGALEDMLFNVSQLYDESIEVKLARIVTLIEPAVLVIMGGVVASLLLSIYLPMFTLLQKVQ
ncbi:MAG TPA: type II secretion system F family protein [Thermoanaerobaculaceae bacterium]|nr:type II secretion system F family protein [Thermoanaerobaculaceae bacterium]